MKVTRRFQVRDAGDGNRYQLWVDDDLAGKCDYLGIEASLPEDLPGTVLDLMVQKGCQRVTAKAFLWRFVEEKKKGRRRAARSSSGARRSTASGEEGKTLTPRCGTRARSSGG